MIVITHNNEIAARAKRVIQIRDGRIEHDSKFSERTIDRQETNQEDLGTLQKQQEDIDAMQERLEASLGELELRQEQLKESMQNVLAPNERQEEA